jgi:protein-arginine kinase activator protein McsA
MTRDEIIKINKLQRDGVGYKRISTLTGIPINTVKSYCHRHPAGDAGICQQCRAPIKQPPHKRTKKFCSDACRMAWWKDHPEQVQRKVFHLTCMRCGMSFDSYGSGKRQYCSRACYADARRKEVR